MRVYRVGKLTVTRSGIQDGVYVDWRMREPGRRWRIQCGREPLWFPLFHPEPSLRGRGWAFWAIGNEEPKPLDHDL